MLHLFTPRRWRFDPFYLLAMLLLYVCAPFAGFVLAVGAWKLLWVLLP